MILKFSSNPKHSGICDFHGQVYPRSTSAVHCDSKSFVSGLPLQLVNLPSSAQKAALKQRDLCLLPDVHRDGQSGTAGSLLPAARPSGNKTWLA